MKFVFPFDCVLLFSTFAGNCAAKKGAFNITIVHLQPSAVHQRHPGKSPSFGPVSQKNHTPGESYRESKIILGKYYPR